MIKPAVKYSDDPEAYQREYSREYQRTDAGRNVNKKAQFTYRRTQSGTIRAKFYGAKKSITAKKRGFSLTLDHLFDLWDQQGGKCALTGVSLGLIGTGWQAASIDRIDSEKGYHADNVQWTCWRANAAKSNMPNGDFVAMCRAVAMSYA